MSKRIVIALGGNALGKSAYDVLTDLFCLGPFGDSDKIVAANVPHKVPLRRVFGNDGCKALEYAVAIFEAVFIVVGLEVVDIEIEDNARQTKAHKTFQFDIYERVAG